MGRQQMIDTYFWEDPWIQGLSERERYCFLYFLTNPLTNLAGIFEITDETIAHHTGIDKEAALPAILERFQKEGKVYRWGTYIVMRNWPKRQNIKSPKVQVGIERILDELPLELLEFLVKIDYKYPKTRAVLKLKIDIAAEEAARDLSTSNPQAEGENTISDEETTENTVPIPYPYGTDRISHYTTLHSTTLHSTETPAPLRKPLGRLLAGIRGIPE